MFKAFIDLPVYLILRALFGLLRIIPRRKRESVCEALVRTFVFFSPGYRAIADRNISLVFPDKSKKEREELFDKSLRAMGIFIADAVRLDALDAEWARTHVKLASSAPYEELKERYGGRGIIYATGHLGSFEVLGRTMALFGYPMSFIVRDFNLRMVDAWWRGIRENSGNRVISRTGAFSEVIRRLEHGQDCAILFDQNVKRNHAIFVPFFGRLAATTKTVALAALRTKGPVIVGAISRTGDDQYTIKFEICNFDELCESSSVSHEEKVSEITERVTRSMEKLILESPEEWFWMHRRWKTTPEGVREDFYD